MFTLLVRGWRNINHSIALVNQYHLLAFTQRPDVRIFHEDMSFASPDWNPANNRAGFDEGRQSKLEAIAAPGPEDVDAILTIAVPFLPTMRKCSRQATFIVTEFGLQDADFAHCGVSARWYEEENRSIVTPSNWCKRKLGSFGFEADRVQVIPHGVDQSLFFPIADEEQEMARHRLGFEEGDFVFLNLGGMMDNKGVDILLAAFAIVLKKHPNARLLLKDMRHLYQYSTDHLFAQINRNYPGLLTEKVLSAIRVVSMNLPVSLMRAVYGAADVYASPYRAEGFNLPVLEAMACGLTTLVTKGGPTDDFCNATATRFIESRLSREPIYGQVAPGEYLEPSFDALVALMESEITQGRRSLQQRKDTADQVPRDNQWGGIADQYLRMLGHQPNVGNLGAPIGFVATPDSRASGRQFFRKNTDLIILIPVYKKKLDELEAFSIRHTLSKLKPGRLVRFIGPENIEKKFYESNFPGIGFDLFPDEYFDSIDGYNYLLLSEDFYKSYLNYEFMLIHQTDAILLVDELDYWCSQKYDYIGAPWPAGLEINWDRAGRHSQVSTSIRTYVGNGGLSLRRTKAAAKLLVDFRQELEDYCSVGFENITGFNEDIFFATFSQISKNFVAPDPITASLFSTEYPPDFYLKHNGNKPPMGGHAWAKFDARFWLDLIKDRVTTEL
jgi:glycosyltransferase involved in cell wall biosynthesis